jgi:hypothetical protein
MSKFRRWQRKARPLSQFGSPEDFLLTNLADNHWLEEPKYALSADPGLVLLHDYYHFLQFLSASLGYYNRNPPVYGPHWRYAGRFIPIAQDLGCGSLTRRLRNVMAEMQKIPPQHVEAYVSYEGIEDIPARTRKKLGDLIDVIGHERVITGCAAPGYPRTNTGLSIQHAFAARLEALRLGKSRASPAPLSPELHRFLLAQTALLDFQKQHNLTDFA